jgi:hypothetical protein
MMFLVLLSLIFVLVVGGGVTVPQYSRLQWLRIELGRRLLELLICGWQCACAFCNSAVDLMM